MLIRQTFTLRVGNRTAEELIAIHEPVMKALEKRDPDAAEDAAREHVARSRREHLRTQAVQRWGA